jgi:hypothetical protein
MEHLRSKSVPKFNVQLTIKFANVFHVEESWFSIDLVRRVLVDVLVGSNVLQVFIPVVRYLRRDEGICQQTCDPRAGDDTSQNVYCYPETSEAIRNQPPVEGYE